MRRMRVGKRSCPRIGKYRRARRTGRQHAIHRSYLLTNRSVGSDATCGVVVHCGYMTPAPILEPLFEDLAEEDEDFGDVTVTITKSFMRIFSRRGRAHWVRQTFVGRWTMDGVYVKKGIPESLEILGIRPGHA